MSSNLERFAAIIFLIQSISWTILTLVAICVWAVIKPEDLPVCSSYECNLANSIYGLYFYDSFYPDEFKTIVKPKVFLGFMCLEFLASIVCVIVSASALSTIVRRKAQPSRGLSIAWIISGSITVLLDFIFWALLTKDYVSVKGPKVEPVPGVVMTLAARGYVLWVMNVTLLVMLATRLKSSPNQNTQYNGYPGQTEGYDNSGYQSNMYGGPGMQDPYSAQSSQYRAPSGDYPGQTAYKPPPTRYQPYSSGADSGPIGGGAPSPYDHFRDDGNTAAYATAPVRHANVNSAVSRPISNQGYAPQQRMQPVPPPQIPEPDYQREPKTVLKNRSQYNPY